MKTFISLSVSLLLLASTNVFAQSGMTIHSGGVVTVNGNLNLNRNLLTGLIAYFPFSGNANDFSGNGLNGTVTGAMLVPDRFGSLNCAYSFNGFSDKIEILGNHPELSFASTNKFSISIWFKMLPPPNGNGAVFFSKQSGVGNTQQGFNGGLLNGNQNIVGIIKNGTSGVQSLLSTPSIPYLDNKWHHWCYTFDNGLAMIYLDNSLIVSSTTFGAIIGDNTENLIFGTGNTGNLYYLNGILDDIRIYNRILSVEDVSQLFHENGWGCY
jgi:hypothetical protein